MVPEGAYIPCRSVRSGIIRKHQASARVYALPLTHRFTSFHAFKHTKKRERERKRKRERERKREMESERARVRVRERERE